MTSFPYRPIRIRRVGIHWRPFTTAILSYKDQLVELDFLVDSGADFTVVPKSVGEQLGFETPTKAVDHFMGAGGGVVPYVLKRVRLQIGEIPIIGRIAWALEEVTPVLGRLDVFDQLSVSFDRQRKRAIFKR